MEKRVKKTTGMFTSGKQGSLQMRTKEADGQGSEGRAQCVRVERKKSTGTTTLLQRNNALPQLLGCDIPRASKG